MTTVINFKEMPTKELRDKTINLEEISDFGRFLLNGNTTAKFDTHFVGLYLNGRKYFEYSFKYDADKDEYELEG